MDTPSPKASSSASEPAVPPQDAARQVELAAPLQSSPTTWWLTRFVMLRMFGFVYLVAFLITAHQFIPLAGHDGLTPSSIFLERVEERAGGKWEAFRNLPTIFYWNSSDAFIQGAAWTGVALSAVVMLGFANTPLMLVLWGLYLSFSNAGGLWYGYGWDMQVPEMGLLGALLCPLLDPRPFARSAPPVAVLWLHRWLLFRIMVGAFLIKWRGDECWRDLTALNYHYETQPIPNSLSPYLHFAPEWTRKFGVLFNHFVEIVVPIFMFLPVLPMRKPGARAWEIVTRSAVAAGGLLVIIGLVIWQMFFKAPTSTLGFVMETGSGWLLFLMAAVGIAGCVVPFRGAFLVGAAGVVALFVYWQSTYPIAPPVDVEKEAWVLYFFAMLALVCSVIPLRSVYRLAAMGVLVLFLFCRVIYLESPSWPQYAGEPPDLRALYFLAPVAFMALLVPATKLGELPSVARAFRIMRHTAGVLLVAFQVALIVSGNLAFLNWLTLIPSIACIDDSFWRRVLPGFITRRMAQADEEEQTHRELVVHRVAHVIHVTLISAYSIVALWISTDVVENLCSKQQAMNDAKGPAPRFFLLNTYGLFGSIGRDRDEWVVEGTYDSSPDEAADWREYEFKVKAGDLKRRPPIITPYYYRLDWQIWIGALGVNGQWIYSLVWHLLEDDPATHSLMAKNPFPDKPPRFIRVLHYRYKFAKPGNAEGLWWTRERVKVLVPPVSLNAQFRSELERMGWLQPKQPAP